MTALADLAKTLASARGPVTDRDWPNRARALLGYVARVDRDPVFDYWAIRDLLAEHWELPVVETEHSVGSLGPIGNADRDYGRCSVRLLDFLGETRTYIVVRRAARTGQRRMLWALLHELGHFVHHFEMLLSLSTLYQRLSINPRLEAVIGEFAMRAAKAIRSREELEADLFAVDWLLPRWLDDDAEVRRRFAVPAITPDGWRIHHLRVALDDRPLSGLTDEDAELFSRVGAQERERAGGPFPSDGSRARRASWVLFNRKRLAAKPPREVIELRREYFRAAGYPPRYIPELTRPVTGDEPVGTSVRWLERVDRSAAAEAVDSDRWTPLLVPHSEGSNPRYYIPIAPVRSREQRDSLLRWRHMMKSEVTAPRRFDEWLGRAREQAAGLLLFPRNPAERRLDAAGLMRT
jgi:hypothetical protein